VADPRHTAKVLLNEARVRRNTPFAAVLLRWAKSARTRGRALSLPVSSNPTQLDLFNAQGGGHGSS